MRTIQKRNEDALEVLEYALNEGGSLSEAAFKAVDILRGKAKATDENSQKTESST